MAFGKALLGLLAAVVLIGIGVASSSITQPGRVELQLNGASIGSASTINLVAGSGVVLIASPGSPGHIDIQVDINTAVQGQAK